MYDGLLRFTLPRSVKLVAYADEVAVVIVAKHLDEINNGWIQWAYYYYRILAEERRNLYQRKRSTILTPKELRTERRHSISRWQQQWDAAEKSRKNPEPETLVEAMLSSKAASNATSTFATEVLIDLRRKEESERQ
ncbi:hypothetical protein EVAR_66287_1 [Eumeta japonica]|uniref:Uncharacterized protein n=1 Tax=Eumeta variegata TaxID=151549 RepID=A0A4C1YPR7_EUMVA|nr:hypothetical protein EVAR_66287_1 [Eumeta japonica]